MIAAAAAIRTRGAFENADRERNFDVSDEIRTVSDHCKFCLYPGPYNTLMGRQRLLQGIHLTLEAPDFSKLSWFLTIFITSVIVMGVISFLMETVPEFSDFSEWQYFETVSTAIFTVEYVMRLTFSRNRSKFVIKLLNLVDLIAIAPFYITFFADINSDIFRILRVVRLGRIFKVLKKNVKDPSLTVMGQVLLGSGDAVSLLVFFIALSTIIFSSLLYYAELGNPDSSHPFQSIPECFYCVVITMTTVGYGDHKPGTALGQLVCSLAGLLGLLVIALPITILGTNFGEMYSSVSNSSGRSFKQNKDRFMSTDKEIFLHLQALRYHRIELDKSTKAINLWLKANSGKRQYLPSCWSTLSFTIINGLSRIERYIAHLDKFTTGKLVHFDYAFKDIFRETAQDKNRSSIISLMKQRSVKDKFVPQPSEEKVSTVVEVEESSDDSEEGYSNILRMAGDVSSTAILQNLLSLHELEEEDEQVKVELNHSLEQRKESIRQGLEVVNSNQSLRPSIPYFEPDLDSTTRADDADECHHSDQGFAHIEERREKDKPTPSEEASSAHTAGRPPEATG
mmetsp:Transcript_39752/g.78156  ORF Transcript_39752/g.78156 Transcript_39752/m.78156 type:complete len:567 (+) Transcript_39752:121-1821(+)|eukprot:CAMPEP_0175124052 /NCGR_PEP_ID=MMETSP0087-20121206/2572_1 /TAXON_ID=136419 /ORGANISM="Unknown Unknown, Strain D1" /LENGTH=566 /DNA_ID=CAMNT_0016405787 /DNA_START=77 /DNA_END=1777 /DNA_ORIENTATION=+